MSQKCTEFARRGINNFVPCMNHRSLGHSQGKRSSKQLLCCAHLSIPFLKKGLFVHITKYSSHIFYCY